MIIEMGVVYKSSLGFIGEDLLYLHEEKFQNSVAVNLTVIFSYSSFLKYDQKQGQNVTLFGRSLFWTI